MLDSHEHPTWILRLSQICLVWAGPPWPALSYDRDLCRGTSKLSAGRSVINSAWRCYLSPAWPEPFEKEAFLYSSILSTAFAPLNKNIKGILHSEMHNADLSLCLLWRHMSTCKEIWGDSSVLNRCISEQQFRTDTLKHSLFVLFGVALYKKTKKTKHASQPHLICNVSHCIYGGVSLKEQHF